MAPVQSSRVRHAYHFEALIRGHKLPYSVAGADAGIQIAESPGPGLPPEIVSPRRQTATVYRPGQPPLTLRDLDNVLDGADVLPGFGVTLREVFEVSLSS